ncbi:MAG: PD-(D/E)XK nuclease family protein [Nitriliruptoraceae bacterium]
MTEPARTDDIDDLDDVDQQELLAPFAPSTPPLIDDAGRVRLSFSRIDSYQNCPRKFRYAYIDRLPSVPSPHLSFGSSVHAALEQFYDRKLPGCPPVDELLDALYTAWESEGFADLDRDEQVAFYRQAQQVLRRYHQRVEGTYRLPAATEAWFDMPFDDEAVVVGSIDRVDRDDDGALHVVDYKTNRRAQDRQRVAKSLQLGIYALACEHLFGQRPATVSLDFLVPGIEVAVPIDDIDLDAAHTAVIDTARAIREGKYEPTPNRLCDWCDFKAVCPAWDDDSAEALGPMTMEADRLRREVVRKARQLHELETGLERVRNELDAATAAQRDS